MMRGVVVMRNCFGCSACAEVFEKLPKNGQCPKCGAVFSVKSDPDYQVIKEQIERGEIDDSNQTVQV